MLRSTTANIAGTAQTENLTGRTIVIDTQVFNLNAAIQDVISCSQVTKTGTSILKMSISKLREQPAVLKIVMSSTMTLAK